MEKAALGERNTLQYVLGLEPADVIEIDCGEASRVTIGLAHLSDIQLIGPRAIAFDAGPSRPGPNGFLLPHPYAVDGLDDPGGKAGRFSQLRPWTLGKLGYIWARSFVVGHCRLRARRGDPTADLEEIEPESLRSGFKLNLVTGEIELPGIRLYTARVRVSRELLGLLPDVDPHDARAGHDQPPGDKAAKQPRVQADPGFPATLTAIDAGSDLSVIAMKYIAERWPGLIGLPTVDTIVRELRAVLASSNHPKRRKTISKRRVEAALAALRSHER
jgi:hypothetical protein